MNRPTRTPYAPALKSALAILVTCALVPAPAAAWTSDPAVNTPVCTAADNQSARVTVPDGLGGVFIGWNDARTSTTGDLYVQHIDITGNAL